MSNLNDKLRLIYVHHAGENYKSENIYEFIFSDITNEEIFDNETDRETYWGWFESPASINANPPSSNYIEKVLKISTNDIKFTCLHENDFFSYIDAIDGIVALAWEILPSSTDEEISKEHEELIKNHPVLNGTSQRMVFDFGMSFDSVKDVLYERDINIKEN